MPKTEFSHSAHESRVQMLQFVAVRPPNLKKGGNTCVKKSNLDFICSPATHPFPLSFAQTFKKQYACPNFFNSQQAR